MTRTVLVVAAHPDDEVLGCGGTIARHARAGDQVHVLIMAEGVTSRDPARDRAARGDELSQLAVAANRAGAVLGAASVRLLDFPDNRMDSVARLEVIKQVEAAVAEHRPSVVYSHFAGDVNVDHGRVHEAVIVACRPTPGHMVERVALFEVPSSTEWQPPGSRAAFAPNWFVDITASLATKLEALRAYDSEMRQWPHPRSYRAVEALAAWRGASVGIEAAEAFSLARHIWRDPG